MNDQFTWLSFYKELSDWLLGKQNNQPELISILKDIGITGFRDGTEKGKEITLQEIDPFTFLAYLNKFHSDEKRVEILQDLRRRLNFSCPEPTDVSGIPTTHPMKVHLFPWKTIRGNNDINVLWKLFGQVKEGKVDERLFQTALNIKSVGKGKLSIVLFYANPEKYVPLDSNTSSYLRSKKLGYTYDSFASYNELSEKIVKTLGKRPWEISYEAYNYKPESDSSSIGSIRTLFEKLEDELEDDMDYHIFYRGQSDKSFGLIPSIYREKFLIQNENRIFRDIIAQSPADFKGCTSTFELKLKRAFDIICSLIMIIILSPVLIILSVMIKLDSKGPVLFKQVRVTTYGRKFKIWKFRTMVNNADKLGTQVTTKGDARITRMGHLLRKVRLDELPQLFNVLKGDMTFVGTRPEVPKYTAHYTEEMMATFFYRQE